MQDAYHTVGALQVCVLPPPRKSMFPKEPMGESQRTGRVHPPSWKDTLNDRQMVGQATCYLQNMQAMKAGIFFFFCCFHFSAVYPVPGPQ